MISRFCNCYFILRWNAVFHISVSTRERLVLFQFFDDGCWNCYQNAVLAIFDTSEFFLDIAQFRLNIKNFHSLHVLHNIWPRKSSNIINISDGFHINNFPDKIPKNDTNVTNSGWVEALDSLRYPWPINCEKIKFEDLQQNFRFLTSVL